MANQAIDIHVHMAGTGENGEIFASEKDCYMSEEIRQSASYLIMLVTTGQLFGKVNNETIRRHLLDTLAESKLVGQAVFLAMDRPFNQHGNQMDGHLYTPNDYVADLANLENLKGKVLFGASVHPDRPGALRRLEEVVERGAVLLKWIPSSQNIDPTQERYRPFYAKLKELGLPLLCHVGAEHAIPPPGDESDPHYEQFNAPRCLVPALEAGVTVIGAHCGLPLLASDADHTDEFFDLMHEADAKGWKLYADISALTLPMPRRMVLIERVLKELPHDRLLFGSDYPVPVSSLMPGVAGEIDPVEWADATLTRNPLDRNVKVIRALGFAEAVFTKASEILRMPANA